MYEPEGYILLFLFVFILNNGVFSFCQIIGLNATALTGFNLFGVVNLFLCDLFILQDENGN